MHDRDRVEPPRSAGERRRCPSARTGRSCTRWPAPRPRASDRPRLARAERVAASIIADARSWTTVHGASARAASSASGRRRAGIGRSRRARTVVQSVGRAGPARSCTSSIASSSAARRSVGRGSATQRSRVDEHGPSTACGAGSSQDRRASRRGTPHRTRERGRTAGSARRHAVDRPARRALVHLQRRQRAQHAHPLHFVGTPRRSPVAGLQQCRRPHAEHAGRHVGALDRRPEAPHLVRLVARHRRIDHAVETPAVVDDPGEEPVAAPPSHADRGSGARRRAKVVDRLPASRGITSRSCAGSRARPRRSWRCCPGWRGRRRGSAGRPARR